MESLYQTLVSKWHSPLSFHPISQCHALKWSLRQYGVGQHWKWGAGKIMDKYIWVVQHSLTLIVVRSSGLWSLSLLWTTDKNDNSTKPMAYHNLEQVQEPRLEPITSGYTSTVHSSVRELEIEISLKRTFEEESCVCSPALINVDFL